METIGFIGGGQMAEALVKGIIKADVAKAEAITVSDPSVERRRHLAEVHGVRAVQENLEVIRTSRLIVLAVKPQVMGAVLGEIAPSVTAYHLVVSIAAGVRIETLETALPEGSRVVRVMPNTPALVGAGAAGISPGRHATKADLDSVSRIFQSVGISVLVPEDKLDAVTGLSGSGPAYVFGFIEALVEGGVREGLPRHVSRELAIQTVFGAALLARETGRHPAELRDMVTSPGGTTVEGLRILEIGAFRGLVMDAVSAAADRARELGREAG
ncbi:MAG: pyrroline-5-carboxylate reductase [Deltaproteobacteria bacterium]